MARYIDKDKLIEAIERETEPYRTWDCTKFEAAMDAIESVPTADVVEVVRCKDCKFYDKEFTNFAGKHICSHFDKIVLDDNNDFCSYGEPKDKLTKIEHNSLCETETFVKG